MPPPGFLSVDEQNQASNVEPVVVNRYGGRRYASLPGSENAVLSPTPDKVEADVLHPPPSSGGAGLDREGGLAVIGGDCMLSSSLCGGAADEAHDGVEGAAARKGVGDALFGNPQRRPFCLATSVIFRSSHQSYLGLFTHHVYVYVCIYNDYY